MKLVILDRDGVINHQDGDKTVASVQDWQPIDGSLDAIADLSRNGFTVVIATNQAGLSEGLLDLDDLEAIHTCMTERVENRGGEIAAIFYCPHLPEENCHCRKPKTGLLDAIELEFDMPTSGVPFVGDRKSDLLAALTKGCDPILVKTGQGENTLLELKDEPLPNHHEAEVFNNLREAVNYILRHY